ncbi:peptidoglycan D,D-transpeptidase FtsI family protein [Dictyobacter arantiisoli]|uniref:Peptidoglycan glycosyltransferase n=1 Tax=Dictyobacter arantiisoli TaxID=2014874 RepID=A0A5A5TAL4_9CHLR|nr:penicillin-binding protein 2 [Dictyobacter arantiisoli]GCF08295.1 peptidoglycan glycosyltransferase [Dictyobacter arantiisoli]
MSTELRRARNRQMVIFLLVCTGMVVLSSRLYYWQITNGPRLAAAANAEHIQNQTVSAPRGLIYDANGALLATNVVRDDVYIEPSQLVTDYPDAYQSERDTLVQKLHSVLTDTSLGTLKNALNSASPTVRIATSITPEQSQKLQNLHLPYTFLEPRTWRTYPGGDLASQILGYVQEQDGASNVVPQGIYGIEKKYNTLLAGKSGSFTAETDLNGNPLTVGSSSEQGVVNSANITLTIDSTIQYEMQQALTQRVKEMNAESGSAIVLNVKTGAIVAMAGAPSFDPNNYGVYAANNGCRNQLQVYSNPVLYCAYEPGSTMKVVTMAAALDLHLIKPTDTIDDTGTLSFADGTPAVSNWEGKGYGIETMTQVLQHSANVGAAWVATQKLGAQRFYPYLANFGFGQATGVLEPESAGLYRSNTDPGWSPSDLARQSFGQSILVTPLQMAVAYQAIANGGTMMQPYLVSSINSNGHATTTQPRVKRQIIHAATSKTLTQMLVSVAQSEHISVPGYHVAIKTGTSTIQGLPDTNTDASVAGYLPASNPQFVILVELDHPTASIYGGSAAGPLWANIAQQLMWHYSIPPDDPASLRP